MGAEAVFLFFYFLFLFFTKIYFYVRNLYEYTPAAPLPGGRAAGAYLQKKSTKNYTEVPGRPAAGQRGGRPPGRGRPLHQCRGLAAVRVILCYEDTKQEQPFNKSTRIVSWQQVSFF